jgi:hypothetical protein
MWAYLTRERIAEIRQFFSSGNVPYDAELRSLLLDSIDFQFVGQLRNYSNNAYQLSGDLNELNSVPRLADGSIPFEIWLRNAIEQLSFRDTANVLNRALDELTNGKSIVEPIRDAATTPQVSQVREKRSRDDMVAFAFLAAGLEAGKSVARIMVPRHDNGAPTVNAAGEAEIHQGTGWLLAPDLVITNHHVINARSGGEGEAAAKDLELQAANTTVQFDYDGKASAGTSLRGQNLMAFDKNLDFAILRLASAAAHAPLRVNAKPIDVARDSHIAVNIIQHPNGGPKKVALRNNLVYDSNYSRLRYFTDTQHGSSGSPVFDDTWQVVALHRASKFVDNVALEGRSGGWVNEGTQMAAIVEFVKRQDPEVFGAIAGATDS